MRKVVEAYDRWNIRVPTPKLNSFLEKFQKTQQFPPNYPKIHYISQVGVRPPKFVLFYSKGTEIPKPFERQILNALREEFGLQGVPIRIVSKSKREQSN